ncbi:hypothetical protein CLOBOL_04735 [Enterocloster bolteae ATCC BAA-613]|uniref:Uncharacterized protein n=1 Tax=Enterocloster bolteae (strain ATCC BAA-613 / DSM 15670 / CCUG 46953 / JCM 12243 / WAL 16351) TaxID=411902 RepID=A8RWY1_ENTBW|nr:hypothetical protein CLOBOL_04735 [Enterocloster bolteae ATCC BAA-613]
MSLFQFPFPICNSLLLSFIKSYHSFQKNALIFYFINQFISQPPSRLMSQRAL